MTQWAAECGEVVVLGVKRQQRRQRASRGNNRCSSRGIGRGSRGGGGGSKGFDPGGICTECQHAERTSFFDGIGQADDT